ncbi:hypothetical protein D3C71_1741840 [compost metagenome]
MRRNSRWLGIGPFAHQGITVKYAGTVRRDINAPPRLPVAFHRTGFVTDRRIGQVDLHPRGAEIVGPEYSYRIVYLTVYEDRRIR